MTMKNRNLNRIVKKITAIALVGVLGVTSLTACKKTESAKEEKNDDDVRKIVAVTGGAPEPYIWQNEDGTLDGYDIAVFNEIMNRLPQYEFDYEISSDIFTSADAGYAQVIVQHLGSNDERRDKYLFSYPYYFAEHGLLVAEDNDEIKTFADLAGHSTEVLPSSFNSILFEKYNDEHPDNPIILNYVDADTSYLHVADGTIDFAFFDYISIKENVEELGIQGVKLLEVDNDDIPNANTGYTYFVFPKSEQKLQEDVDEVLLQMIKEGVLEELSQKYLSGSFAPDVEAAEKNH